MDETPIDPIQKAEASTSNQGIKLFLRDKGIVLLALAGFLLVGALTMGGNFVGIYMMSIGGNETFVGALLGFAALCEIPAMVFFQPNCETSGRYQYPDLIFSHLCYRSFWILFCSFSPVTGIFFVASRVLVSAYH